MALGGKARPTDQADPRTPEASAPSSAHRDESVRLQVRAHVQQVLRQVRQQQAASRPSSEKD